MSKEKKLCSKCLHPGEYVKFDTFAYWFCKRCKVEIPERAKLKEINLLDPIDKPESYTGYPTNQEINDVFDWGASLGESSGIQLDDPDADDYDTKST